MIVVTGADGLVGRAVCERLHQVKLPVLPVVRARRADSVAGASVVDLVAETIPVAGDVRGVIHLAAAVPHSPQYPDTDGTAQLTRRIDQRIRKFVQQHTCPIVYASSCSLYDPATPEPKHEDTSPVRARTPYFAGKLDGERLFAECGAVIARLSNPVGPHLPPVLVLSRFIGTAADDGSIEIWGTGSREQDFVDARDVARFLCDAVMRPVAGTFNVASGRATRMDQLAATVVEVVRRGAVRRVDIADPEETRTARYSIEKVRSVYGWIPQYSLADAIRSVVAC